MNFRPVERTFFKASISYLFSILYTYLSRLSFASATQCVTAPRHNTFAGMASPPLPIISIAVAGLVIAYALSRISSFLLGGYHASLPPGPKGYPLVGNINDLPKPGEFEAHHWLKHKELYGALRLDYILEHSIRETLLRKDNLNIKRSS